MKAKTTRMIWRWISQQALSSEIGTEGLRSTKILGMSGERKRSSTVYKIKLLTEEAKIIRISGNIIPRFEYWNDQIRGHIKVFYWNELLQQVHIMNGPVRIVPSQHTF